MRTNAILAAAKRAIVYQATNTVNGNRYIGVTCNTLAWRRRKHENAAAAGKTAGRVVFLDAIRKHGKTAFQWEVLAEYDNYDDALQGEVGFIERLRPEYNITKGGQGHLGNKHTEEWKKAASERQKRKGPGIEGLNAGFAAAREANVRPITCVNDGVVFYSYGECLKNYGVSPRHLKRVLSGNAPLAKGFLFVRGDRSFTDQERLDMLAKAQEWQDAKHHNQGAHMRRRIICEDTGEIFNSIVEAGKKFGVTGVAIQRRIALRAQFKNGPWFSYIEDNASDGMEVSRAREN